MAHDAMLLWTIGVSSLLSIAAYIFVRIFPKKRSHPLPPGPKGWPIIGCLPLLGEKPHVTLAQMAKQYGPIIYLKLGSKGMVVASTRKSAKAFLKEQDLNFSNRSRNIGATHMAYDSQDFVFADYGPRWKLLKKLSNLHMLGSKALENWAQVRCVEVGHMLRAMCDASSKEKPVVVPEMLAYTMVNMISQVITNKRLFVSKGSESNEFKDMVVELMTRAGHFNIGDFIPSVAWMDIKGNVGGMKKLHKKFNVLLTNMIEEHVATAHEREGKPNFLDALMNNLKDNSDSGGEHLSLTNVKGLLLNIFTAGSDTSSSIIEWALSEMLIKPSILKRAHEEMDQVIGKNRRLEESDIPNLPYLQAICKESFRKHPSTPLNLPRVAAEDCIVNGYFIPKNTRLSVNIWAIGRDPNVWKDPLEFNPERFLDEKYAKINPSGNDFKLIPFGSGRRICAEYRMGIVMVGYVLGSLIHSFDWRLPNDVSTLNMEEAYGLAVQKAVPLSAMVTPRLEPSVYALLESLKHDQNSTVVLMKIAIGKSSIAKYLTIIPKALSNHIRPKNFNIPVW